MIRFHVVLSVTVGSSNIPVNEEVFECMGERKNLTSGNRLRYLRGNLLKVNPSTPAASWWRLPQKSFFKFFIYISKTELSKLAQDKIKSDRIFFHNFPFNFFSYLYIFFEIFKLTISRNKIILTFFVKLYFSSPQSFVLQECWRVENCVFFKTIYVLSY